MNPSEGEEERDRKRDGGRGQAERWRRRRESEEREEREEREEGKGVIFSPLSQKCPGGLSAGRRESSRLLFLVVGTV